MASRGRRRRRWALLLLGYYWAIACCSWWPIWTATAQPVAANGCHIECLSYHQKRVPLGLLQSYKNNTCGWKVSVILVTVKNRSLCASPADDWVQEAMRALDARKAAASVPKEPTAFSRLAGAATLTPAWTTGRTHPPGTAASAGNATSAVPRTGDSLALPTTAGLEPQSTLLPSESSPTRLGKDPVEEESTSLAASPQDITVSPMENSVLSDSSAESRAPATLALTTVAQRTDSAGRSGTRPSAGGSRGTSMSTQERNNATRDPLGAFGGDSASPGGMRGASLEPSTVPPTLGFHRENTKERSRGAGSEETPEVTLLSPSILDKYQTQVISALGGGVIAIIFAGIAWAHFKARLCARPSAAQTVGGIVYSPVDTCPNSFALQDL